MRITCVCFNDSVVSDKDFIRNVLDDETSRHGEVLVAVYVGKGTIAANRTIETISSNDQVTAFAHGCQDRQGQGNSAFGLCLIHD